MIKLVQAIILSCFLLGSPMVVMGELGGENDQCYDAFDEARSLCRDAYRLLDNTIDNLENKVNEPYNNLNERGLSRREKCDEIIRLRSENEKYAARLYEARDKLRKGIMKYRMATLWQTCTSPENQRKAKNNMRSYEQGLPSFDAQIKTAFSNLRMMEKNAGNNCRILDEAKNRFERNEDEAEILFEQGKSLLEKNEYEGAKKLLVRAKELSSLFDGEIDEQLRRIETAEYERIRPKLQALKRRADVSISKGEYDQTLVLVNQYIDLNARPDIWSLGRRTYINTKKGNWDEVIQDYEFLFESQRYNFKIYLRLGSAYLNAGKFEKAVSIYTECLKNFDDQSNQVVGSIADTFLNVYSSNETSAIDLVSKIISRGTDFEPWYLLRANMYQRTGNMVESLNDLAVLIDSNPSNAAAYAERGAFYYRQNELDKAVDDFTKSVSIKDSPWVYELLGKIYYKKKEYGEAIESFSLAIRQNPREFEYYNQLSWIYSSCPDGEYHDAKKAIELAARAYAGRKSLSDILAFASANARDGQFDNAVKIVSEVIDVTKKRGPSDKMIPFMEKTLELYKNKKPYTAGSIQL